MEGSINGIPGVAPLRASEIGTRRLINHEGRDVRGPNFVVVRVNELLRERTLISSSSDSASPSLTPDLSFLSPPPSSQCKKMLLLRLHLHT
jgi:hypothetical protein